MRRRKLVLAAGLVFVYDSSPSQVGVGFFLTLLSMVFALYVKPFADPVLGSLYAYSLAVQMLTLFYGLLLITYEFGELSGGESGWLGPVFVPGLVIGANASVLASVLIKFIVHSVDLSELWVLCLRCFRICFPLEEDLSWEERRKQIEPFVQIDPEKEEIVEVQNHAFDFDLQERDAVKDLNDAIQDAELEGVFKVGPVPAEFAGVKRMEQHAGSIEQLVRVLMNEEMPQKELKTRALDFKVLLQQMKTDAAVLHEEVATIKMQEALKEIAYKSIDRLEVSPLTFSLSQAI
eukprot:988772-Rhodomonas_salina.2